MGLNRSEFLKLTVWGFVATLLPLQQIKALSFISNLQTFDNDNYVLAIEKAKLAKEYFFKKEYQQSEKLYLECITLAPADIRFYDNLQNVYSAQGKRLLCVELFKNGLIANPNKIDFYDRSARSLMRLELGYPKIAEQYRNQINSPSLLEDAKQIYDQAIQIDPSAKFLEVGKQKVVKKIDSNALTTNYWTSKEHKKERKLNRNFHNSRYDKLTNEELLAKLEEFDKKRRNTLYFDNKQKTREKNIVKEKKKIYKLLIINVKKERQLQEAILYANQLYTIDNKDTFAVKILKRLYIETNNYTELINFQRKHNEFEYTVYSHLGLMYALNLKYEKEIYDVNLLNESIDVGEDLYKNWGLIKNLKVKVVDKLSEAYILKGSFSDAKILIKETIETTTPLPEGMINSLIYCYANIYYRNGEYYEAKNILLLGLLQNSKGDTAEFPYIEELALKKEDNKFSANLNLYYLLFSAYSKLNDD